MLAVFDFLAALGAGFFALAGWSAYTQDPHLHALCGLATGITVLAMHTVMFLFFVGTARAVKDAVLGKGLSAAFINEDKRLLAMVMAAGSFGPLTIVVSGFLGSSPTPVIRYYVHPGLMMLTVATNTWAYLRERSAVKLKHAHVARARAALALIEQGIAKPAAPPDPGPPSAWVRGGIAVLLGMSVAGYDPYRRFIMGDTHAPSWFWIAAGVPLIAVGSMAMVRARYRA